MSNNKDEEPPKLRDVKLESGIPVKPIYTPEDIKNINYAQDIGNPGEFPFTRGIHKYMYRFRPYTMRQYSGFATAKETNKRFKYLIEHGQTGLNVAFDLPTQLGLNSDDPRATGEVGRVGMAIDSLADMEDAFEDIPIDKISVSMTINSMASVMMAMYFVIAEKHGVPLSELRGNAQNDILKEYVGRGTWIYPVEPSIRLISDTIEFCANNVPKYYPVSVCGYHIRESGANPIQEIAYAYAIAKAYIDDVLKRGVDPNKFVPKFSFNFDIHGNIFEQIAKFRAARRLWAKIIKNDYNLDNPKAQQMKMIAGGGGGGLVIEQPENNIVRGAYYALISALSGTQTMATQTMALCSYDEAYTIPSEKAALISLRTMQMLIDEMGAGDTADPLAGSYYVESLTNEFEKRIVDAMSEVDRQGGIVKAVSEGYVQAQVSAQAYEMEKAIQNGEFIKIGVNKYRMDEDEERTVEFHEYKRELAEEQVRRLNAVHEKRDEAEVKEKLGTLREKADGTENLMPYLIEAVKVYATVGEIADVFREVFGEFDEPVRF
jgi:methylmalonyl-CoA mutase N-terminal domain/subunit